MTTRPVKGRRRYFRETVNLAACKAASLALARLMRLGTDVTG